MYTYYKNDKVTLNPVPRCNTHYNYGMGSLDFYNFLFQLIRYFHMLCLVIVILTGYHKYLVTLTPLFIFLQIFTDSSQRPSFLSEKALESALKHIAKKFPNFDSKVTRNWL